MIRLFSLAFLLTAVAFAVVDPAHAQAPLVQPPGAEGSGRQGGPMRPPPGPLTIHQLTPSVYWAEGGIGNVGFIVGDRGVIVVDATMSAATAQQLLAGIAKITPLPVTAVILTHGDLDHVGGLGAFPPGIAIFAQESNKKSMEAAVAAGRSSIPADHMPTHAVASREAVVLDGVKLELLHWAPAHTAGDLVVYLPAQKIVFTGDIFAMDQPRALIHAEQQGSSAGWVTSAKAIVALGADRFVVGHGDVQSKQALVERVKVSADERDRVKALVAQGKTLTEIQAEVGDPPPGRAMSAAGGPRFTPFSEVIYRELTAKP